MRSLKVFQDFIEKATGKEIPDWMNAYYLENAMSSANKAEADLFARVYYQKIIQALTELNSNGLEFEEIYDYMMAKHGIERNREMAVREALTASGDMRAWILLYSAIFQGCPYLNGQP